MVGVSVDAPVGVQVVPASSAVGVKVQVVVSGSFSGSLAVPVRFVVEPSVPLYGPPAFAVGAPFTPTVAVRVAMPPSSSMSVDDDRVLAARRVGVRRGDACPHRSISVTVALLDVVSPQSTVAVWVSFVPTSVNDAETLTERRLRNDRSAR